MRARWPLAPEHILCSRKKSHFCLTWAYSSSMSQFVIGLLGSDLCSLWRGFEPDSPSNSTDVTKLHTRSCLPTGSSCQTSYQRRLKKKKWQQKFWWVQLFLHMVPLPDVRWWSHFILNPQIHFWVNGVNLQSVSEDERSFSAAVSVTQADKSGVCLQ